MRKINLLLFSLLFVTGALTTAKAQIKKVAVETYYIADANDATDTTGGRSVASGEKTYRVFITLNAGYKLTKIYGDANHTLKISSTDVFYNNIDRPAAVFGYQVNKSWFQDNPMLALDSWMTIGYATKSSAGVLKINDTDGSLLSGTNNNGGTALIAGGILNNNDPATGIALSTADGLMPLPLSSGQWVDDGFKDLSGIDTSMFGSVSTGSEFISNAAYLQQNAGVGDFNAEADVLVAQLTTTGELSFELNIAVIDSSGQITYLVADGDTLLQDEVLSPLLKYPQQCGCTDPAYIEYNPAYACGVTDSCKIKVKLGCMDPAACNFDPEANYNVSLMCCYPGYCNDRNIEVVCNDISDDRHKAPVLFVAPNPASDYVVLTLASDQEAQTSWIITDASSRTIHSGDSGIMQSVNQLRIDVHQLVEGFYMITLLHGTESYTQRFIKE